MNYDPQGMSAWSVRPHLFEGRQYSSDEELSDIVLEMLKLCHPKIFSKYVEKQLENLPKGTKTIYIKDVDVPEAIVPLMERFTQDAATEQVESTED
jgi:hypothetical protein